MRLVIGNHFGIGDLWESREFVREWMRLLNVPECEYACRYPAVFEDLPEIKPITITEEHPLRTGWYRKNGIFFVNSWLGARNAETRPSGDYVLWPGVGCCVEHIQRMHRDYAREAGFKNAFTRPAFEYIPDIHYGLINQEQKNAVNRFMDSLSNSGTKLTLICNGPTGSQHAANFEMLEMLNGIAPDPKRLFIFTERRETERPDVVFTDDITGRKLGETDVLAISYLSTFCDVIVGRCSGAQMPCETRSNWLDPHKTLVSFTQHRNGACFVREPEKLGLKMRLVHSDATTSEQAREVLKGVL